MDTKIDTRKYPSLSPFTEKYSIDMTIGNNINWYIQEKIDGSQLSFKFSKDGKNILFYNKNKLLNKKAQVFQKAIDMITAIRNKLHPKLMYHGEAVCSVRHGIVVYDRIPTSYIVIYDIQNEHSQYLSPHNVKAECSRIGLESIQILYYNTDPNIQPYDKCVEIVNEINKAWDNRRNLSDGYMPKYTSMLECEKGNGCIEGVVFKHHALLSSDGTYVATKKKLVANVFREREPASKPKAKINPSEFLVFIGRQFATEPRFQKAIQHLKERGDIREDDLKDATKRKKIYVKILTELDEDFEKEYIDLIKNYLWAEFSQTIMKEAREGSFDWLMKC